MTHAPPAPISRRSLLAYALALGAVAGRAGSGHAAAPAGQGVADTVVIDDFARNGTRTGQRSVARVVMSDAEWRARLSPAAYAVTRHAGTEPAFSGAYDHNQADGLYACVCCATTLFDSRTKFDSGTGWPSFWQPISRLNVVQSSDDTLGMVRVAVSCHRCDAHLGHVFEDGPKPTGLRYCMNSVALNFTARA